MTTAIAESPLAQQLAELWAIENCEQQKQYLASHPELVSADFVERLAEDIRQLLRTDLEEGLRR